METRPVDRGWAWVICGAAFTIGYVNNNSVQVLAVTILDLTEEFDTSITVISLVLMANMFCGSFSCIITVNFLIPTFGLRRVCTPAACVYTLCGIAYAFSPNVYVFIFLATIRGIASGMLVIPAVSLMSFYFKRYSSLAASLALSGSSVASITWPSLTRYVLSVYSLRGALLLCGALEGHMILSTMLLRPLSSYRMPESEDDGYAKVTATNLSDNSIYCNTIRSSKPTDDLYKCSRAEETPDNAMKFQETKQQELNCADQNKILEHQIINNDVHLNSEDAKEALIIESSKPLHPDNSFSSPCKGDRENCQGTTVPNEYEEQTVRETLLKGSDHTQWRYPQDEDSFLSNKADTMTSKTTNARYLASVVKSGVIKTSQTHLELKQPMRQRITKILDFSLFKQWSFVWCLLAVVPGGVNFLIFTYLPTIVTFKGMSKDQGAVLLTILGSVDLGSRMVMGIVADSKVLRVTTICGMCMVLLGVISLFVEFFNDMKGLVIMSVLMGLFIGTRMSLISVMYIEVVGLDKMAKAYSIHTMITAVVNASFNPVIGNMLETSGVNSLMYFIGCLLITAGAMLYATPLIARLQDNCQKKP